MKRKCGSDEQKRYYAEISAVSGCASHITIAVGLTRRMERAILKS